MLFILQIMLVLAYLKNHYSISLNNIFHENISIDNSKISYLDESLYSSYYSEDIIGDDILLLDNLTEKKKLSIWKNTYTKNEVVDCFPNIEMMKMVFNNKIEDNGKFKINFLEYIEEQHFQYIAGEINAKKFKASILNPPTSLTDSW